MSISAYTWPVDDGMRVRHDAQARFTVKAGKKVLEDRLIGMDTIGAALTVAGIMYNGLAVSGGVSWWDPTTGRSIGRPKVQIHVRHEDVLVDDDLCTCPTCR